MSRRRAAVGFAAAALATVVAATVLAAVATTLPSARAAEKVDLSAPPAAEWIRENHFGVYCGEFKVGWMRRSLARTKYGGADAVVREVETHIDVAGDGNEVETHSRTLFAEAGDQLLLTARTERREQERRVSREIVRREQRFDVVTVSRGESTEGAVSAIPVTLGDELGFERLAALAASRAGGPVGASLAVTSIDLGGMSASLRTLTVTAATGEGAGRVFDVTVEAGGARESLRLATSGTPVSGALGTRFRYVVEAPAVARDPAARTPLADLARVPLDGDLGDLAQLRRLVVAWDDPHARVFPVSGRQTVRKDGKALVIEVSRDADVAKADDDSLRAGLADDEGLVLSDPFVGQAATRLLSGTSARGSQVARILQLLSSKFEKAIVIGTPPAPDILRAGRGDCTEHARAFVALCRVSGIPARTAEGLSWAPGPKPAFAWHQWAEVAIDGRWIAVDPTTGANPAPATHIAVEPSPEARTLLWGAKLRLVEADHSEPAAPGPK